MIANVEICLEMYTTMKRQQQQYDQNAMTHV